MQVCLQFWYMLSSLRPKPLPKLAFGKSFWHRCRPNFDLFPADNFHTLSSQFPHLNQSLNSFSQQSLHALGQQALGQQALHQRSVSLPQRLSPQTGLYDTNPNSLLHALRTHGQPKSLLSLSHQHEEHEHHHHPQQQLHAPAVHRRLEVLQHELPDREASDNSPSGSLLKHHTVLTESACYLISRNTSPDPRPTVKV